jgi:hypothetical protein
MKGDTQDTAHFTNLIHEIQNIQELKSKLSLKKHYLTNHSDKIIDRNLFNTNIKVLTIQPKLQIFLCKFCKKSYFQKNQLKRHMWTKHQKQCEQNNIQKINNYLTAGKREKIIR